MENKPLFDEDFFKSTTLDGNGKMFKSIPTVKVETKKKTITVREKTKSTKEVEKYIKEVEEHFKKMDIWIKDVCVKAVDSPNSYVSEEAIEMKLYWKKFKGHFEDALNRVINNPDDPERKKEMEESPKGEWDKTRVRLR